MKKIFFLIIFCFSFFTSKKTIAQEYTTKNKNFQSLIEKKLSYNKHSGYMYKIQLFYGSEKIAIKYIDRFKKYFPKINSKLNYEQPYWKVKVGSFRNRLSADRALNKIKEHFSGAIVIEK